MTTAKCARGTIAAPAARAPIPAPASPPAENAAWNEERTGLCLRRSSASPWALAETLRVPNPAPKPKRPTASPARPVASDVQNSEPEASRSAANVTVRLPPRSQSEPAIGIATSAPTEIAKSANPSCAVESEA